MKGFFWPSFLQRANRINSVSWNLLLLTLGSLIFSIGIKGIVIHNTFLTGGAFGGGLLIYYLSGLLSPSFWYLLINVPLFFLGWFFVGRRFFFYSLYGVLAVALFSHFLVLNFHIQQEVYAAVAGGMICGTGLGICLRSLGSTGGVDILAIILNDRYSIRVGTVYFLINSLLFLLAASLHNMDILIASIMLVFISSQAVDYILSLFNQRKIVYVISDHNEKISKIFNDELHQGATFIQGKGAYSGRNKLILMAITNNIQLKRLESIVFEVDEQALFIVENTFSVLGSIFGARKKY